MTTVRFFIATVLIIGIMSLGSLGVTSTKAEEDGGTLVVGWTQGPDTLNPLVYETVQAGLIFRGGIYETLVGVGQESLKPVPLLATSWETSKDGKQWTFKLRKGVKWHDGEKFTSKDVQFTINSIKDYKIPGLLSYIEGIQEVERPDDYTVVLHYKEPLATVLYDLQNVWIIPEHKWKKITAQKGKKGPLTFPNKHPIGTGPFKFVKWEKNKVLILEANTDYWQEGKPHLNRVVFRYFSNYGTMLLALKKGKIDVIPWEIPATDVEDLKSDPEIQVEVNPNLYYRWINFNVSGANPALAKRKVRLALNYAIDRQFLVDLIHRGYASPGVQIVQKATPYWFDDNLSPYKFDLEYARQLLEESGYTDRDNDGIRESPEGKDLEFTLMVINRWPEELKAAAQIKKWWKDIGVKLNIQAADGGTILSKVLPLKHDMYLWGFSGNPDPTFSLNIMLKSQIGMWNGSGYANPVYDALFREQKRALDPKDRQKIIYHMQEILQGDAPHAVLYYMKAIGAYRKDRFTEFVNMPTGILSQLNSYSLKNVRPVS